MPNRLKNLVITKVALCPKGQNPEADFVFFKSDEPPVAVGPVIQKALNTLGAFLTQNVAKDTFNQIRADRKRYEATMEAWSEVTKNLDDLRTALATSILWPGDAPNVPEALKSIDQFAGTVDEALRSLSKEDTVKDYSKMSQDELVAELKARDTAAPADTVTKEDLAAIQKTVETQAEELKKANERAAALEAEAKLAKEKAEKMEDIAKGKTDFPNLPVSDEEKGALVGQMRRMDTAAAETMRKSLAAANEALKTVTKEIGGAGEEPESAKDKLKKAAEAIRAATPTLSYSQAYDQACVANPVLFKEARSEA